MAAAVDHRTVGLQTPDGDKITIVHISDTHLFHDSILSKIPDGDVLVHSGDFGRNRAKFIHSVNHGDMLSMMDKFFGKLPHKLKIFVAGNHEITFNKRSQQEIQERLKNVTYLQDSSIVYKGIKFYGTPWVSWRLMSSKGFATDRAHLRQQWDLIPDDTDVLVTHMPPKGIRDLGRESFFSRGPRGVCDLCHEEHNGGVHKGSGSLRGCVLNRVRPMLHLFGHMHGCTGIREIDGTVFSNAASQKVLSGGKVHTFDLYPARHKTDLYTQSSTPESRL